LADTPCFIGIKRAMNSAGKSRQKQPPIKHDSWKTL
jgi:hypothetical protein